MRILPGWRRRVHHETVLERSDGRSLLLAIVYDREEPAGWGAVAIEADAKNALDDHSHAIIGKYVSLRAAKLAAGSFGRAWEKGAQSTCSLPCTCGEIDKLN